MDRELMDPAHVMEQQTSRMTLGAAGPQQQPGAHTEGNLDFLKQPVDMGVRAGLPGGAAAGRAARACVRQACLAAGRPGRSAVLCGRPFFSGMNVFTNSLKI